jgi:hypothetical protein
MQASHTLEAEVAAEAQVCLQHLVSALLQMLIMNQAIAVAVVGRLQKTAMMTPVLVAVDREATEKPSIAVLLMVHSRFVFFAACWLATLLRVSSILNLV